MNEAVVADVSVKKGARVTQLLEGARQQVDALREFLASNPPGTRLNETIDVAGPAANEIAMRVEQLMHENGCTSATVGPSTHRFARTVRPGAMVASTTVASVATLGLCLPLMFLRRTEECTVTIIEHPTGAKVTIVGRVPRPAVTTMRSGLGARPGTQPAPTEVAAEFTRQRDAGSVRVVDATTTARPPVVDETRPRSAPEMATAPAAPTAATAWLQFDTGERIEMRGRIVVGRAPDVPTDQPDVRAVSIDDPNRTVSKTHFRLFARDDVAWIEDLHSTNGTVVATPGQPKQTLVPMQRVTLVVGSRIEFGDRVVSVVAQ